VQLQLLRMPPLLQQLHLQHLRCLRHLRHRVQLQQGSRLLLLPCTCPSSCCGKRPPRLRPRHQRQFGLPAGQRPPLLGSRVLGPGSGPGRARRRLVGRRVGRSRVRRGARRRASLRLVGGDAGPRRAGRLDGGLGGPAARLLVAGTLGPARGFAVGVLR
jgi:hypothetical protein